MGIRQLTLLHGRGTFEQSRSCAADGSSGPGATVPARRLQHPGHGREPGRPLRRRCAIRDGETFPSRTECPGGAPVRLPRWWPRGWSPATGSPSGPSTAPSGSSPCSASLPPARVLVPVNTRFKGPEAAEMLTRSGARVLVTVTDFLGTDYVSMLTRPEQTCPALDDRRRGARGTATDRAEAWHAFLDRATRRSPGRGRPAPRPRSARRSLGHPLHLGDDGRAQRAS